MKLLDNKADDILDEYITANFKKIHVESGECRYNYKCHMNAVHEALQQEQDEIALVFYRTVNSYWSIHFLNVESDGTFIDNTIGRWSEINEYRFVRFIEKASFFNVNSIFNAYIKEIRRIFPWYVRIFSERGC